MSNASATTILIIYIFFFFFFFQARRVRDRKAYSQETSRSISRSFSKSRQRSVDSDSDFQEIKTKMGMFHSSSSLPNSIPEPKISPRNSSESVKEKLQKQRNHQEPATKTSSGFNSGMYLLLISLTVTVLWGRICAILFTSIWLYFLPCWSPRNHHRPESVRKWPERESKDCKKRVIMEGLLQRKHSRGH